MLYNISLAAAAQSLVFDGVTTVIVEAVDSTAALALVKAARTNDNDTVWDNATITAIPQNLSGITFSVETGGGVSVEYTAVSGDTWEEVAEALTALLVAEGLTATWTVDAVNEISGTLIVGLGNDEIAVDAVSAIADGGHGYEVGDVLTVSGGTSTTAATVTVATVDTDGAVTGVTITEAGTYTATPANDADTTGGGGTGCQLTLTWAYKLTAAVSDTQGTGYQVDDVLTLSGGTATTASTVTVATVGGSGEVLTVTVTEPGEYSATPSNPVSTTGGNGTGCTITATWGEFVTAVSAVADGGTSYEVDDVLTVVGGTSTTPATLTVSEVTDGAITAVTVSEAGAYSVVPTNPVSVTGGSGSEATFTLAWDAYDNIGDETLTVAVADAAENDLTSEFIDEVTSEGSATDNLSFDILSTGTSNRIIGQFKN